MMMTGQNKLSFFKLYSNIKNLLCDKIPSYYSITDIHP